MILDTFLFTYTEETKVFSTCISNLGTDRNIISGTLIIRSERTGILADFKFVSFERDPRENELLAWHYAPTDAAIEKNPGLRGTRLVIFND